jgi:hypothetical protein
MEEDKIIVDYETDNSEKEKVVLEINEGYSEWTGNYVIKFIKYRDKSDIEKKLKEAFKSSSDEYFITLYS